MIFSEDDAVSTPSRRLLDISIDAIQSARCLDLGEIASRLQGRFPYPDSIVNLWPGEHYRLLAALVQVLRPRLVIEIGTAEGISALSFMQHLPPSGRVVTFDVVPWQRYPRTCLDQNDFASGKLRQIITDLGDPEECADQSGLLCDADLIFVDAAKDGALEHKILRNFSKVGFRSAPILIFDDTRLWNMLRIWREIRLPKLDMTSFGHWCGTGLCEWTGDAVFDGESVERL